WEYWPGACWRRICSIAGGWYCLRSNRSACMPCGWHPRWRPASSCCGWRGPAHRRSANMHEENDQNATDLHLRAVAWGGAMIVAGIVFAGAAAWIAYSLLRPAAGFGGPDGRAMRAAPPALEAAPQPVRAAYDADKRRLIDGYG